MKKKKSFPRDFVRNLVPKFIEKAQQPSYKKHRSKTNHQQQNKPSWRKSLVQRESWQKPRGRELASFTTLWITTPPSSVTKEKGIYLWWILCHATLCTIPWKTDEANSKNTAPQSPSILCSDIEWELHCSLTSKLVINMHKYVGHHVLKELFSHTELAQ